MIRKVLLPVDACRDFQDYIRYGTEIAACMTAELCLLHVARSSRRSHQPRWSAECDFDDDTPRFVSQAVVRRGSPAETIASYANSIDADLILMPTRGRGLFGQLLFGSTTMDVLRMRTGRFGWLNRSPSWRRSQSAVNAFCVA
jgi:Universal stress protein family